MKIRGWFVAALDNLAQPVAHPRVARRAINVEALLAALQHRERHRERHLVLLFAVAIGALNHAGIKVAVLVQLAAGHGVGRLRPRAAVVGKEIRAALRDDLRLVLHILPATHDKQEGSETGSRPEAADEHWCSLIPDP